MTDTVLDPQIDRYMKQQAQLYGPLPAEITEFCFVGRIARIVCAHASGRYIREEAKPSHFGHSAFPIITLTNPFTDVTVELSKGPKGAAALKVTSPLPFYPEQLNVLRRLASENDHFANASLALQQENPTQIMACFTHTEDLMTFLNDVFAKEKQHVLEMYKRKSLAVEIKALPPRRG